MGQVWGQQLIYEQKIYLKINRKYCEWESLIRHHWTMKSMIDLLLARRVRFR